MVSLRRRRNAAIAAAAAKVAAERAAEIAARARIEERASRKAQLNSIEKLRLIQKELKKVNNKASRQISAVVQKCTKKRTAIYESRNEIISTIPRFWFTIFMNHPTLQILLKDKDLEIFSYLDSVNVDDFADPRKGYYIAFNFRSNPFFHNKILTTTISLSNAATLRSIGTTIEWKDRKGSSDVGSDTNRRPTPVDSFFSWFSSPEEDEAEVKKVAKIIKEEIWPNPPIHGILSILNFDGDGEEEDADQDVEEDADAEQMVVEISEWSLHFFCLE